MSDTLKGEIALVTGASRGIGKAIAERLAAEGATVIGTATTDNGAEAISANLKDSGGAGMCLNVTDDASVAAVIKQITQAYGAISILVNNAGITKDNLLMMMKQNQWDDVINTNLTSLYRMTNGVIGRRLVNNDMLLLTTRGRTSGRDHTVPLLYLRDGERLVIIASYGGRPAHPAWYRNLVADPRVEVQVDGDRRPMLASTMSGEDRTAWWPRIVEAWNDYDTYQSRTDRQIPVVWLESR